MAVCKDRRYCHYRNLIFPAAPFALETILAAGDDSLQAARELPFVIRQLPAALVGAWRRS